MRRGEFGSALSELRQPHTAAGQGVGKFLPYVRSLRQELLACDLPEMRLRYSGSRLCRIVDREHTGRRVVHLSGVLHSLVGFSVTREAGNAGLSCLCAFRSIRLRGDDNFVAGDADLHVVHDIPTAIPADFGLAGHHQWPVVHVGTRGVAGAFDVGVASRATTVAGGILFAVGWPA